MTQLVEYLPSIRGNVFGSWHPKLGAVVHVVIPAFGWQRRSGVQGHLELCVELRPA